LAQVKIQQDTEYHPTPLHELNRQHPALLVPDGCADCPMAQTQSSSRLLGILGQLNSSTNSLRSTLLYLEAETDKVNNQLKHQLRRHQ
jgi:hypothetical protein